MDGWYYLHTDGDLIFKRTFPGDDNSPFVRRIWSIDVSDRLNAWLIVVEALALDARVDRVRELAAKWGCDARDFVEYITRVKNPSELQKTGAELFLARIVGVDVNEFWDWLASTQKGAEPDWSTMPLATAAA